MHACQLFYNEYSDYALMLLAQIIVYHWVYCKQEAEIVRLGYFASISDILLSYVLVAQFLFIPILDTNLLKIPFTIAVRCRIIVLLISLHAVVCQENVYARHCIVATII